MSAKVHWMSSNQFNLSCLRSEAAIKTTIGTCQRKGLSLYVDRSSSSEGITSADKADNVDELKAVSMEPSPIGPQIGLSPSCRGDSSQEELRSNGLTSCADNPSAGFHDGKAFDGDEDNSSKELPVDSKTVVKQSIVETKGGGSMSLKQAARQSYQKFDQKQLGKRVGIPLERQHKRSRLTTSKVAPVKNEKYSSKLPAVSVPDISVSSPGCRELKTSDENEAEALAKQGVHVVSLAEPATLSKAQPKARARARDITKEEAALEFQQCVSLLQKYGVLNTREYYLSQNFPSCAPHPGFVGDKLQSKRCKICKILEDANSTVICDECQGSFHLSCCLPRLNPKHFDREDDWYCSSCRKQKRRMGRFFDSGRADNSGDSAGVSYISKVKLGTAYQANVPLWPGKVDHSSTRCHFGMEESLSEEAKEKEKARLLQEFELKAETWRRQSANNLCDKTPENWLKCHSVLAKSFKDCNGHKHSEIICGKWRRAPLNVQQFDRWECFCAIEWDPCHADCAVPQELPTEEILQRMQRRLDLPPSKLALDLGVCGSRMWGVDTNGKPLSSFSGSMYFEYKCTRPAMLLLSTDNRLERPLQST